METNRTHAAAIIGALYNEVFCQIVSGDCQGTVRVWDVRSGHMEFEFRRAHGDHKMTCMSFDVSKRRLYTGAEDGEVRLWNFSSGQHLKTYVMKQPSSEITGLLWAQTALTSPEGPNTFVVALAWDRRIYVWPGSAKATSAAAIETKYILEDSRGTGHTDDISCICSIPSVGGMLATGGDDGCIVLWKIQDIRPPHRHPSISVPQPPCVPHPIAKRDRYEDALGNHQACRGSASGLQSSAKSGESWNAWLRDMGLIRSLCPVRRRAW